MVLQKAMAGANVVLGVVSMLCGLVLIVLKVLIVFGVIQVPTLRDLLQGNVWDFLIKLLDQAGWLVVVGIILVYIGSQLLIYGLSHTRRG